MKTIMTTAATCLVLMGGLAAEVADDSAEVVRNDPQIQAVIDEVDALCREQRVPMVGPERAERLAELVREKRPRLVVEAGTAVGYSALWIARELKALGEGHLITMEINPQRAEQAEEYLRKAGLEEFVTVQVGDANELAAEIEGPIDFLFLDHNYPNYYPTFRALEDELSEGAVVVADNAGIGATGMGDYLTFVREKYRSEIEWFDVDLPWAKRDALEITVIEPRE